MKHYQELIQALEKAQKELDKARSLAEDNEDIAIMLMQESELEYSLDDNAADIRATINNLKSRRIQDALEKVREGLLELDYLEGAIDNEYSEEVSNKIEQETGYSISQLYFKFANVKNSGER